MKTLLIVDDCPEIRSMLRSYLSRFDFHINEAASGELAIEMIQNKQIDFVISDLNMANGDGRWLLKEIRSLVLKPRVIIFSGDLTANKEMILGEGAFAYFFKPSCVRELLSFICQQDKVGST